MTPLAKPAAPRPLGFSLLEVLLALAILGFALSVLLEVSGMSLKSARSAKMDSEAALVAQAVLAEFEAGTAELANISGEWVANEEDGDPEWSYEVVVEPTALQEMVQARIVITEINTSGKEASDFKPVTFELVRWFPDPTYMDQLATESESP